MTRLTPEQNQAAIAYNRRAVGRIWTLADLPQDWNGTLVLRAGDVNADQVLDSAESNQVDWTTFSRTVAEMQSDAGLLIDGKLGPKTLQAAFSYHGPYGETPYPPITLKTIGNVSFCRPDHYDAKPGILVPVTGSPLERRAVSIWNRYGHAISQACDETGIDRATAVGVFGVEAGGLCYDAETGLLIIRVEIPGRFKDKSKAFTAKYGHGQQAAEWKALEEWARESETAAFRRTSFGIAQVMGFNHRLIGYASAQDMAESLQRSAYEQVFSFFKFCKAMALLDEIRDERWADFAETYNGPGQIEYYAKAISEYVAAARTALKSLS